MVLLVDPRSEGFGLLTVIGGGFHASGGQVELPSEWMKIWFDGRWSREPVEPGHGGGGV